MPVSPRLRYLIQKPLVSYFELVYRKSYHILPASAVDVLVVDSVIKIGVVLAGGILAIRVKPKRSHPDVLNQVGAFGSTLAGHQQRGDLAILSLPFASTPAVELVRLRNGLR